MLRGSPLCSGRVRVDREGSNLEPGALDPLLSHGSKWTSAHDLQLIPEASFSNTDYTIDGWLAAKVWVTGLIEQVQVCPVWWPAMTWSSEQRRAFGQRAHVTRQIQVRCRRRTVPKHDA